MLHDIWCPCVVLHSLFTISTMFVVLLLDWQQIRCIKNFSVQTVKTLSFLLKDKESMKSNIYINISLSQDLIDWFLLHREDRVKTVFVYSPSFITTLYTVLHFYKSYHRSWLQIQYLNSSVWSYSSLRQYSYAFSRCISYVSLSTLAHGGYYCTTATDRLPALPYCCCCDFVYSVLLVKYLFTEFVFLSNEGCLFEYNLYHD